MTDFNNKRSTYPFYVLLSGEESWEDKIAVEVLYQAFKTRMMEELAAEGISGPGYFESFRLKERQKDE